MVYELDCQGTPLSVTMLPTDSITEPWRVGASLREAGALPALAAQGRNRSDALGEVVRAWSRAGYTPIDWDAIRVALAQVRAV